MSFRDTTFLTSLCNRLPVSVRTPTTLRLWALPRISTFFRRMRQAIFAEWCATTRMISIRMRLRPRLKSRSTIPSAKGTSRLVLCSVEGGQEWKIGAESDNLFLNENTGYLVTSDDNGDDATLARERQSRLRRAALRSRLLPADDNDESTPFSFQARRPDLEQAIFIQDRIRLNNWTISAGLRWDHYQLVVNDQGIQPRFSVAALTSPRRTPFSTSLTTASFRRHPSRTSFFRARRRLSRSIRATF